MEQDEWASAAGKGDHEALISRIAMDKDKMYGIAYSYLRSEADALDAIQETVCRVWMKRKSLRDPKYFSTWMIRILIRVCLDAKKKQRREIPFMHDHAANQVDYWAVQGEVAGHTQGRTAERLDMAMLVQSLRPELRMVVTLKYYRDMTVADIAELMEKPEGTIKTWLHKALTQLRRDMELEIKEKEAGKLGAES